MKRIRLDRWATHTQLQPPRNPRIELQRCPYSSGANVAMVAPRGYLQERRPQTQHQCQHQRRNSASKRRQSTTASAARPSFAEHTSNDSSIETSAIRTNQPLNAPSPSRALRSAKLAALHSRLSLPSTLPLQTLARCLIDSTVDPRPGYNNLPLAHLGQDLLAYYTAEWLLCNYPRLPMPVLFAAQYAYVGSKTLDALRREWGVEYVAAPGEEVDPGLLQFGRVRAGNAEVEGGGRRVKDMPGVARLSKNSQTGRKDLGDGWRRGMSSRIVYDDEFGDLRGGVPDVPPYVGAPVAVKSEDDGTTYPMEGVNAGESEEAKATPEQLNTPQLRPGNAGEGDAANATTLEAASANFIRALFGALHLHTTTDSSTVRTPITAQSFHKSHILSRHLPLHQLFHFTHPTRDLSRLCAREGFEPPVARLISETGRLSRTPVFIVGVFSGGEKLGEGAGGSLNEGRVRAAAAALRSWYLYRPVEEGVVLPSSLEGSRENKKWVPQMIDIGEIVT